MNLVYQMCLRNLKRIRPLLGAIILFLLTFVAIFLGLGYVGHAKNIVPDVVVQHVNHPLADIITVTIQHALPVSVQQAERLHTVTQFAHASKTPVKAVLNAGFFDPVNALSTSYLLKNGRVVADPERNPSLMANDKLKPYLPAILNRPELRQLSCSAGKRFDIAPRDSTVPADCRLVWSIGAGPQLLPNYTPEKEGFTAYAQGKRIRDPIGVDTPNARSAVAIMPDNQLMLVFVGQTATGKPGLTLPQLAEWLKIQGVVQALALDGGSSTSLWLDGKTWWGKGYKAPQQPWHTIQRPVKSFIVVSNASFCK
jgi:hypothetical protein